MPLVTASADRHKLVRGIQTYAFDPQRGPQDLRLKGNRQVLLDHAQQADQLFGFAVRVDDGFLDELIQPTLAQRGLTASRLPPAGN